MPKSYCYVDESGRPDSSLFVIGIIAPMDANIARQAAQEMETSTLKYLKWTKSRDEILIPFIQKLLNSDAFAGALTSVIYRSPGDYHSRLIGAIAEVLKTKDAPETMFVQIDGMPKFLRDEYANGIRALDVKVKDVRGVRDESEPLIRVADALAGLTRDALLDKNPFNLLFQQAKQQSRIRQIDLE